MYASTAETVAARHLNGLRALSKFPPSLSESAAVACVGASCTTGARAEEHVMSGWGMRQGGR